MSYLKRSVSVSTATINEANNRRNNIQRSMSVGEHSPFMDKLVDTFAQLEMFVKDYPQFWNLGPNVQANLSYASYRLPAISSRLSDTKLEDLKLANSIMRNIRRNLPQTLKTGSQGSQKLTGYIEQAIVGSSQAIRVYTFQNSNCQFGPNIDKDLHSSNDVMAAALILKQYFSNLVNRVVR